MTSEETNLAVPSPRPRVWARKPKQDDILAATWPYHLLDDAERHAGLLLGMVVPSDDIQRRWPIAAAMFRQDLARLEEQAAEFSETGSP